MQTMLKWATLGGVGLATASASVWGVIAYQLSIVEVVKVASFLGTVALACLKRGKVFTVCALLGWILRVAHTAHMALLWDEMPTKWHTLLTGGKGHLALLLTTVYDQVIVLSTLPRWLADMLCMLHATVFGCLVHRYLDTGASWWYHATMCIAVPQACVIAPVWAMRWRQFQKMQSQVASGQRRSKLTANKTVGTDGAEGRSSTTGVDAQPAHDGQVADMQRSLITGCSQGVDAFSSGASSKSAAERTPAKLCATHKTLANSSFGGNSMVQALRATPYTSKLSTAHQVCVKLDCDVWYDQLSYKEVATNVRKVLQSMPGSQLHLTAVAARPGCIMVTMNVQPGSGGYAPHSSAASAVASDALAQAMLPQLLQAVAVANGGNTTNHADAVASIVRKVQVQVDDYVAEAKAPSNSSEWQLQPLKSGISAQVVVPQIIADGCEARDSNPSSSPWLGVAELVGAPQPLPSESGLRQLVEVQVWGISKLDEVTGWSPPAPGQHAWSADGSTDLRILARFPWGDYARTHVLRLRREPSCECTIAEVMIELPWHMILQHHAGATRNSLLLFSIELCSSQEVLLSSSSLITILNDSTTVQASTSPASAWWWGVSDAAVKAAASDIQACSAALVQAGTDVASSIPAWLGFISDLQLWLLEVQRMAMSSGLCSCSSLHVCAAASGTVLHPCLDDASRQQLWEGLAKFAAQMDFKGVHSILQQQMQRVVAPAQHKPQKPPTAKVCRPVSLAGSWVQLVQQALWGHPCSQCEAHYKQQLRRILVPAYRAGGFAVVACAFTVLICAAQAGERLQFLISLPWFAMHLASILALYFQIGDQAQSCSRSAWGMLYAYIWRCAVRLVMWAGNTNAAPLQRLYSKPGAWLFSNAFMSVYEQVHVSMVLPTARLTQLAVLMDLPCTLLLGLQECPSAVTYLNAPIAAVLTRLVCELWLRKVLAPCAWGSRHVDRPPASLHVGNSLSRTHSKWD